MTEEKAKRDGVGLMESLPKEIARYLLGIVSEHDQPAYLGVGRDSALENWSGCLEIFGIETLRRGVGAAIQIPFLEGVLPADDTALCVPLVKADCGTSFDIRIFKGDCSDGVLLIGRTTDALRLQFVRQLAMHLRTGK